MPIFDKLLKVHNPVSNATYQILFSASNLDQDSDNATDRLSLSRKEAKALQDAYDNAAKNALLESNETTILQVLLAHLIQNREQQPDGPLPAATNPRVPLHYSPAHEKFYRPLFRPFLHRICGKHSTSNSIPPNNTPQLTSDLPHHPIIRSTVTPSERPINPISAESGRRLSEIEQLHRYHLPEFDQIIPIIVATLKNVVNIHESIKPFATDENPYAHYDTISLPPISIDDYVRHIANSTCISPSSLISALIVLDRLAGRHPTLLFTSYNIYKLFLVATRIASKVVEFKTLCNREFAAHGGLTNAALNQLEARMLVDLGFQLMILESDYNVYVERATNGAPQPLPVSSFFKEALTAAAKAQSQTKEETKAEEKAVAPTT